MGKNVKVRVTKEDSTRDLYKTIINKADYSVNIDETTDYSPTSFLMPVLDQEVLKQLVSQSTILPQCINAYVNNIPGFGMKIQYKEEHPDESPEMIAEFNKLKEIIDLLNLDMESTEVFKDVIRDREEVGIGYIEVVRNLEGLPIEINRLDPLYIRKTIPLEPRQEVSYWYKGREVKRPKRFCIYKQQRGNQTIYYKEFGDPRVMNYTNMKYEETETTANEIIEFKIGTEPYGSVRWSGLILNADGARRAEELNYNYFKKGRHIPMMILLENGTLTDASWDSLQESITDIEGEAGQHAYTVLEMETQETSTALDEKNQTKIQVIKTADILQKDELFQEYLENHRKKFQSAFNLPDIYTGYTADYNRATAYAAIENTEKQTFIPNRQELNWVINNKLLGEYKFEYVEVVLDKPEITNPEDIAKILDITERAGGLSMNLAKEVTSSLFSKTADDYTEDWGNLPLTMLNGQSYLNVNPSLLPIDNVNIDVNKSIYNNTNAGLKDIRNYLKSKEEELNVY